MAMTLTKLPSPFSLYMGAAGSASRKPQGKIEIPALEARLENVCANAKQLKGYNQVCGFTDSDGLPITFPPVYQEAVSPVGDETGGLSGGVCADERAREPEAEIPAAPSSACANP